VSVVPPASPEMSLDELRDRPAADPRVPVRNPEVCGPLDVYYFNRVSDVLGPDGAGPPPALERREGGDVLAYEALNLVDGRRTVSEIRDVLAGRYRSVPLAEIAGYLDLLARAKTVTWK